MIVLAIHKETGEIHKDLQDTPDSAYREGTRAYRAAIALGGNADDYMEYSFASKDRGTIFNAKYLIWDSVKGIVKAVPYSNTELTERRRVKDKDAVEREMIEVQAQLDAANKLGIDVATRVERLDNLKMKHEKVKGEVNG